MLVTASFLVGIKKENQKEMDDMNSEEEEIKIDGLITNIFSP